MASDHRAAVPNNRLLAALPAEDLARLRPSLETIDFKQRETLYMPGDTLSAAYFPETGWVSMLAVLADGNAAEVGIVGREGLVGVPLLLGSDRAINQAMAQAPGRMLRLPAEVLREALEHLPALRGLLLRYALAFHIQVTQTAACNGHHAIDQRLARWLLMAHDRAQADSFPLTQEFLAMMLCVHRPGVTIAARLFQQAGLIRYGNGVIAITDRAGLEAAACECHAVVRRESELLLRPPA